MDVRKSQTFTTEQLMEADQIVKSKKFDNLNAVDLYTTYVKAAVFTAEQADNDSDRFATFCDMMDSSLRDSPWDISGSEYSFLYSSNSWSVDRGDVTNLYSSGVATNGRVYIAASALYL